MPPFRRSTVPVMMLLCLAAQAAPTHETPFSDLEHSVLVRRIHWPVLIEPRKGVEPDACEAIDPGAIRVTEDGFPLEATGIGNKPQARLHALLLDTSASMAERLPEAGRTAIAYLDGLDAGDRALVAAFDDNLVLAAPPTSDRERLNRAVEGLEPGNNTALWDALYYLVRYLETQPGEKAIILISDGDDSQSLEQHDFESVVELAGATPDLVVFPIGLGLPRTSRTSQTSIASRLRRLAHDTGGRFFEIRGASGLARTFSEIRQRLDDRRYVSYVAPALGRGPRDPVDAPAHWRRVKIRAAETSPCRITPLGVQRRLEPARTGRTEATLRTEQSFTLTSQRALAGSTTDLLIERGPLFAQKTARRGKQPRIRSDRKPQFVSRRIVMRAPEIDVLRETMTSPEAVLATILALPADSEGRPSILVHGQTFLEMREALGRVLYRSHADYREWTRGPMEIAARERIALLQDEVPALRDLTGARLTALREALIAQEAPDRYLAEWLGDVDVRDVAARLEVGAIAGLFAATADESGPFEAARIIDGWPRLVRWFGAARSARILTPLLPAYERERDVIGFYRFLLPSPELGSRPMRTLPARPFALSALLWLRELPGLEDRLRGRADVISVDYAPLAAQEASRIGCLGHDGRGRRPQDTLVVTITIGDPKAPSEPIQLSAYYTDPESGPAEPRCVSVQDALDSTPMLSEVAHSLADALDRAQRLAVQQTRLRSR